MNPEDAIALTTLRRLLASGAARELRLSAGLSLAEAGSAAGTSAATLCRWESARRIPHGAVAVRYAHFLETLRKVTT